MSKKNSFISKLSGVCINILGFIVWFFLIFALPAIAAVVFPSSPAWENDGWLFSYFLKETLTGATTLAGYSAIVGDISVKDADTLNGLDSALLQKKIDSECPNAAFLTSVGVNGAVGCNGMLPLMDTCGAMSGATMSSYPIWGDACYYGDQSDIDNDGSDGMYNWMCGTLSCWASKGVASAICTDPDITLPNGQVWQACNLWATSSNPTNSWSYGYYYQWGRNNTGYTLPAKWLAWYDWQDHNDNAWWDTTNTEIARQWPCSVWYHIPSRNEWSQVNTQVLVNTLKLPKAWWMMYTWLPPYTWPIPSGHWIVGNYWSSTPYPGSPWYFDAAYNFESSGALINGNARAIAFPIRCIKNTTPPVATWGILYCWWYNGQGQLGITDGLPNHARPTQVTTGHTFISLSAGRMHTCALNATGKAFCWWENGYGQLGNWSTGVGWATVSQVIGTGGTIATALTFSWIATSDRATCALTPNWKAYCWWDNSEWSLWINSTTDSYRPTPVFGPNGTLATALTFTSIYAGWKTHMCWLTATGKAYCWWGNPIGQLGDGSTSTWLYPKEVVGPDGTTASALSFSRLVLWWSSLASMTGYTCWLTTSGEIYCWGWLSYTSDMSIDYYGDSFVRTSNSSRPTLLIDTKTDPKWRAVTFNGGFMHYCYTRADGSSACRGSNGHQELANPLGMNNFWGVWYSFLESPSFWIYNFVWITAGLYHTCGLSPTGLASCWWWDKPTFGLRGTLDPADFTDIGTPAPVIWPTENPTTPLNYKIISAWTLHTCAITGTPDPLPSVWQAWVCNSFVALGCTVWSPINDNAQLACGQTRTWNCSGVNWGSDSPLCTKANAACTWGNCGVTNESWGTGCSADAPSGQSIVNNGTAWPFTIPNTAPGYTGSASFLCWDSEPTAIITAEWAATNISCSSVAPVPQAWVCNNSIPLGCSTGGPINDNWQNSCNTTRTWNCSGVDGGTDSPLCSYVNAPCACVENPQAPVACSTVAGNYGIPLTHIEWIASLTMNSCTSAITYLWGCTAPVIVNGVCWNDYQCLVWDPQNFSDPLGNLPARTTVTWNCIWSGTGHIDGNCSEMTWQVKDPYGSSLSCGTPGKVVRNLWTGCFYSEDLIHPYGWNCYEAFCD